ncbi:para-nitrobenzyl esterase [Dysgonomonas sp. PFB1-18]|uniref:carboxylesterase/lipase family protein n=1 Tax=unclassified Dysgonomonas TaxID=2630389 RepID=UPI00247324D9|nr:MULTISPECIES: carboxylesterase family protein [unclassified Dysgonomonas]MDH6309056.1 para-nitrobenzyl esterase [Dysgonomonas sp. PF1-14]MDH6338807.1 para-nitrobenzyl esterase [Dysgonomonas sp. PF1-16]MDH6380165.1 para-nitrobenzyl esterase [Dysgonomonas sp. PFB1-18]MDH6397495.1 para-nitrobenzyl esterase [Dysgonomonas sp. PF1-23]
MNKTSEVFIKAVTIASALFITVTSPLPAQNHTNIPEDEPQIQIGENIAIADTEYGKVKGYISRGVYTFLGIPYASETSGKNRFMPPQKHEKWDGIRPAVFYGNSAPQDVYSRASTSYDMFVDHWNYDEISENCLSLNIWTNAIADGKKRPVIVWLHGGGYTRGNGFEQDGYHGENIVRYGDIVFCSINHRLGVFGFTDLSAFGEKYKNSGNAGLLDMVFALQWIHDNIENFGGDPNNVTIIGQSGGGAKVCLLATMPETKGLIHKGVSLSGSAIRANNKDYSKRLGEYIVKEAGLSESEVDKLQDMSWKDYMELAYQGASRMEKESGGAGMARGSFGPVGDGIHLPEGEFFSNPDSPDIPMIFCTTFHEWGVERNNPAQEKITRTEAIQKLSERYGENAQAIYDAYSRNFPSAKPFDVLVLIYSNRMSVVESAIAKKKQDSPVYMAWFGFEPFLFDGRIRAFHCLDISFWFLNTDLMLTHSGGGTRPRKLSYKMADSLLNFARTGNPNCASLPHWPEFSLENGETMILNDNCEVKNDPDKEGRAVLTESLKK